MGGGSKTETTNQNQQATTTPTIPNYALGPVQNYFQGVSNYQNANPYSFVTPMNQVQQQAIAGASGLGQSGATYGQAANAVQGVLGQMPTASQATQTQAQLGSLGPASQASAQLTGPASQVTAANAGTANTANAASLLDNFNSYLNPATDALVNSTLADYDNNAALTRGQAQADAARNHAFGGSNYAFQTAATDADLARARATTDATLRSNAFNTAAGLAQSDASNRQQTNLFNADAQNQYGLANAGYQQSANQFNAGAQNANAQLNAQLGTNVNLANSAAANQYGLANFDAANQNNQFNAGQANQLSQFNTGQANDMTLQGRAQQLQGAGLLGTLAGQAADTYRADLGTQMDLGNSLYNAQNAYTQAPLTQLQNIGNLLNPGYIDPISQKTVTGQSSGVTQTQQSGGLFNQLLGAGSLGVSLFSDRRVKTDIRRIGMTDGGLPVYTFKYKGDDRTQMGVMAQDVEEMQPGALGPEIGGVKTVLYSEVR